MARLTKAEQHILNYPPTRGTWVCGQKRKGDNDEIIACATVNSAKDRECWLCRRPKSATARRLWPDYEAACKKAGIEPTGKRVAKHAEAGSPSDVEVGSPVRRRPRNVKRGR